MFRKLAWLLGAVAVFVPLLALPTVQAAGETYSWINEQTIEITGGHTQGTERLTKASTTNLGSTWVDQDDFTYAGGCKIISFSIFVQAGADGSSGRVAASNATADGNSEGLCSPEVVNSYNGKTVSIQNVQNRQSNASETADQRTVTVQSFIATDLASTSSEELAQYKDQVPEKDEITLQDSDGKPIGNVHVSAAVSTNGGSFMYTTTISNVGEGNYQVCSKVAANCASFRKDSGVAKVVPIEAKNTPVAIQEVGDVLRSCETEGGDLGWFLCPVLRQLDNAVGELDKYINRLLQVPDGYFANQNLKDTWARVRNIAYTLLVPTILIMVIGTALGFEFVSAYTVKKAMPRMIIAILFIALSYSITTFLITLTNSVGNGIMGLLTSSFAGAGEVTLASLFESNTTLDAGLFTGLLLGGLSAVAVTSFGIIFSYALVTAVALFIAFVALSFRQLFLVALLLLAPLAILTWIFPGNDKPWKLWWGTFSKLLLLYPLIMAVMGAGRAFASIVHTAASTNEGPQFANTDLVTTLIILTAYIGPFFFIPAAFKFAGGLFANLAGMANDRSRGLFDTQRKKRAESRAALRERAGANNRFNPNRKIVKALKLNTLASIGADPMSNAFYYGRNIPGMSGKGQKIKSQIEAASSEQTGKLFEELNNTFKFNDKAYRALSGAHDGFKEPTKNRLRAAGLLGKAPTSVAEVQKIAEILGQSSEATESIASNVLMGAAGRLGSLYSDPEMGKANVQAAGMIGLSAHGFASGADLADVGNKLMNNGVSRELAQSFVSSAQVLGQKQRPDIKAGYGTVFRVGEDGKAKFIDGISDEGGRAGNLIKTLSNADLAQAKAPAMEALTPTIIKTLEAGGGEANAVRDQLFSWAGPYSQASVDVKRQALDIINDPKLAHLQLARDFDVYRRADLLDANRRPGPAGGGGGEEPGGGAPAQGQ